MEGNVRYMDGGSMSSSAPIKGSDENITKNAKKTSAVSMSLQIRRMLRNVHSLRSAFYFSQTLVERARWGRRSVLDKWIKQWYEREDPWNYTNCPEETERFGSALKMLDAVRRDEVFECAFEIGCAEGIFTSMLAPRCKSLLAVDVSKEALGRAIKRCAANGVKFEEWDILNSPAPLDLDL